MPSTPLQKSNFPEPAQEPQTVAVVAVPVELFGEVLSKLAEMKYTDVAPLMNKLTGLRAQEAQIRPSE